MSDAKPEVIGPDHMISQIAGALSANAYQLAGEARLSKWEIAVALANACGQILAGGQDMSRAAALERMDRLREVMEGAYDLHGVAGEG